MNIGETLKRVRKERKLTLKVVAKALNISPFTLSEYENNITNPSSEKLLLLFEFYGPNALMAILWEREIVDITDFSYVGKEAVYRIQQNEKYKKRQYNSQA